MTRLKIGSAITIAVAALVLGAVLGEPGNGRAAGAGPANAAPPTIWGAAQESQTLSTTTGSWSGSPTSYGYAWSTCDANGSSCAAISGATAATYKPSKTDVGHTVRVTVTAKNSAGSGQATSAPSAVVSSPAAPTNTTAPAISGPLTVGSTITASAGKWSGSPTSYAYAWKRCDANGNNCATIEGATSGTHELGEAAAGRTFRFSVVATNAKGSTQVTTAPTAAVPGPTPPVQTGCPAGTGPIQVADLLQPARLVIDKASISPRLVTLGTQRIQLHIRVTACNGRPVQGAGVFAVPVPYNQFAGSEQTTGADGTATITETRRQGFPARGRRQHLLAVLVRATKPGEPLLGGVSTRRTVAFRIHLP